MSRAVRESVRRHYGSRGRVTRIEPFGHIGTAYWGRPFIEMIRGLFGGLRRIAHIAVPPKELHAPRENVISAATRVSVIVVATLIAIRFWRRRNSD